VTSAECYSYAQHTVTIMATTTASANTGMIVIVGSMFGSDVYGWMVLHVLTS